MSSSSQVPGDMQRWENVRKLAGQSGSLIQILLSCKVLWEEPVQINSLPYFSGGQIIHVSFPPTDNGIRSCLCSSPTTPERGSYLFFPEELHFP